MEKRLFFLYIYNYLFTPQPASHFHQFFTCHSVGESPHGPYQGGRKCACALMCEGVNECTDVVVPARSTNRERWIFFFFILIDVGGRVVFMRSSQSHLLHCLFSFHVLPTLLFLPQAVCKCALWETNDIKGEIQPSANKCMEATLRLVCAETLLRLPPWPPRLLWRTKLNCPWPN